MRSPAAPTLECAAIQDVLFVGKALDKAESRTGTAELDRMAAMLSRLGGRGYQVQEAHAAYGEAGGDFDPDPDSDFDLDGEDKEPEPSVSGDA